jgi:hypothetical protein
MMVNASMVFGFDSDSAGVFTDTVNWLIERKVETMTAHILTPYPGSRLYRRLLEEGRIFDFDLNHYNTSRAVFQPKGMSPDELEAGYLWSYEQFYSLRNILRRLPESRDQWKAYVLFNLLYRKLGPAVAILGRIGIMGPMARLAKRIAYPERRTIRPATGEAISSPSCASIPPHAPDSSCPL